MTDNTNFHASTVDDSNKMETSVIEDIVEVEIEAESIPDASETDKGIIRLATIDESIEGINDSKAITPLKLKKTLDIPVNDLKASIVSLNDTKADKSELPTKTSQLINDSDFITSEYHDDTKQDVIADLNEIRSGASKGETALQSIPDEYITEAELNAKGYLTSYTETDPVYTADKPNIALKSEIPDTANLATKTELQNGLNNKQDKGDYALKSEIPTNNNQLVNGAGYITADYHDDTKQDVIDDLDEIRSGASKGATALQSYTETDPIYTADKPNIATKDELIEGLNKKQDVIDDLDEIRSGASKGATALQSVPAEYVTETELDAKGYLTSYTETDPVYTADKPNIALKSEIPTKVSSFTNDANYQTESDVASMIASIPQFKLSIVDSLPETGEKMTLYLVPKGGESPDVYDEYIWIEQTSSFEHLGSTAVDLSDYYTKTEADVLLADKQPNAVIVTTQNTYTDVKTFLEEGRTVYFNYNNRLLICDSMPTATIFTFQTTYHGTNMYWGLCGMRANGTTSWQSGSTIIASKSDLPTTTSQLTNDSGFVTQDALLEKTTETWTFTLEDGTTTTKTMVLGA